jgi:alanine racemase
MDSLYSIIIILICVCGAYFSLKYFSDKKIINEKNLERFKTAILISTYVLNSIKQSDKQRTQTQQILDITNLSTDYVYKMSNTSDLSDKIKISLGVVNETLNKLGIQPSESEQNLINITIQTSLEIIDGSRK